MTEFVKAKALSAAVREAISAVRSTFTSRSDVAEVLDRFWCLQDNLALLVEAVADRPQEAMEALREQDAIPVENVVDVLTFTSKLKIGKLPAVAESCAKINDSLWKLQTLLGDRRAVAAAIA